MTDKEVKSSELIEDKESETDTMDISEYFRTSRLISSAYRQGLFREIGAAHSILSCRKIIHIHTALYMMLPKINRKELEKLWGKNYEKNIEIIHGLKYAIGELWGLLDQIGFTKKTVGRRFAEYYHRRHIKITKEIMEHYPLMLGAYIICLQDPQFSKWSIPREYQFDFFETLGKEYQIKEGI